MAVHMPTQSEATAVRIATRPSALALRQTELVRERLHAYLPEMETHVHEIHSEADVRAQEPIRRFGDKGVFVARIEQALLDGEADLAVHSLKDLPVDMDRAGMEPQSGRAGGSLHIVAYLPREDPRDVLITRDGSGLANLAPGSRIGTSSSRRHMQLAILRPDLEPADIRGNVDTRLRRLEAGEYDAIILAAAGLLRLGLSHRISQYLETSEWLPAPGQGIIAVQCRTEDPLVDRLGPLDDADAHTAADAERALTGYVGADCNTPFGALATIREGSLGLRAMLLGGDGVPVRAYAAGSREDPCGLARRVAEQMHGWAPRRSTT